MFKNQDIDTSHFQFSILKIFAFLSLDYVGYSNGKVSIYNNVRSLYQYLRFMPRHGPSECHGMRGSEPPVRTAPNDFIRNAQ